MLLKEADDKSKRLTLLQDLQQSTRLDSRQKEWLREHLGQLRKGIQGEKESAFFLNQHLADSKNTAVIHDLRIEVGGSVAQIDHLLINRIAGFILLETKNYSGSVQINSQGEFTVNYGNEKFGIESPIEQSKRHERVLSQLLSRIGITTRVGTAFEFHHVVLFHPRSIISRPPPKDFDTSSVIKADQFPSWLDKTFQREPGVAEAFIGLANLRSSETVREWGLKLIRQHRPADLLQLPEFLQPKESTPVGSPNNVPDKKRLVCLHCSTKITFAEGKFCWNNEARFKGGQYCREHQALF